MSKSLRNWIIVLAIGFVIWVCPTPQGLTPNAWHLFAVFAATIAGFILQPISMGAVAFIALTFCAITGVLKTGQALMGFGNGSGPVYFGAGYVSQGEWWRNGFIITTINVVIWLTIGMTWWKFIGLY